MAKQIQSLTIDIDDEEALIRWDVLDITASYILKMIYRLPDGLIHHIFKLLSEELVVLNPE